MAVVVTVTLISPPVCTPLFAVRGHTLFSPLVWPLCSSKTINTELTTTRLLSCCSLSDPSVVAVVTTAPSGGAGFFLIRPSGHSGTGLQPEKNSEVTRKWHQSSHHTPSSPCLGAAFPSPAPPTPAPAQCLCCKQSFLPPFILVKTFQIYYVLDKLSVHACGWNAALGLWRRSAHPPPHPPSPHTDMSSCISVGKKKRHVTYIL